MATTSTMLFGPEWMRPKHPARPQNPPSPPPNPNQTPPTASSYSSLVAPAPSATQDKPDPSNPFLYSKEEMLRIYKEGGGRGGLGLEVERWEGVVREVGNEPSAFKEWTEAERKLFSGSLNSEIRRRQSSDYLSPLTPTGERPKLNGSGVASPMRERFNLIARRRDSSDQTATTTTPRKLSLNANQGPFGPTRDPTIQSPRTRGPLTPGGIDGVLSGGDTWMSRRRASEAGRGSAVAALRGEGDGSDGGGSKIKEEDEEEGSASTNWRAGARDRGRAESEDDKVQATTNIDTVDGSAAVIASNMANLALKNEDPGDKSSAGINGRSNEPPPPPVSTSARAPTIPADLASIEWSYLDPQGQVQGPFRADLMQNWSAQGYFTPELPVKRTTIDFDWTPVGMLVQRLGTENIFLTAFDPVSITPPGLQQPSELPPDPQHTRDAGTFGVPYQPIPTRTSQISALESYYGTGSPTSHSPASSFGAGRFGNGTPDPNPYGGRLGGQMSDSPAGARGTFAQDSYGPRRQGTFDGQTYPEPQFDPSYGRAPYNNYGPARTSSTDSYGFGAQQQSYPGQVPWGPAVGQNGLTTLRTNSLDPYASHVPDQTYASASPLSRQPISQDSYAQRDFARVIPGAVAAAGSSPFEGSQPYTQSPSHGYASVVPSTVTPLNRATPNSGVGASFVAGSSPSTWSNDAQAIPKRTGGHPFDQNTFPTSRNTISLVDRDTLPPQAWAQPANPTPKTPIASVEGATPWYNASVGIVDEAWRHVEGPNSLTVSNLGQHNQQLAQEEALAAAAATVDTAAPQPEQEDKSPAVPAKGDAATPASVSVPTPQAKSKRKGSIAPAPAPVADVAAPVASASPTTPAEHTGPSSTKPVWSTDDAKKPSSALSLREIQEAEAREARKAADRKAAERERATRTALAPAEDVQPFTASWGLPTSQAGAARGTQSNTPAQPSPSKEASVPATPSPAVPNAPAPVWAANGKTAGAVKKTMKEIQEEEERRKAREAKEAQGAIPRRAYADTTTKVIPTVAVGGAWTTVGSNGKTAASAPAAKPAQPTAASIVAAAAGAAPAAPAASRKPAATTPARPAATSTPAPKSAPPAAPKADESPVAPSPDFMKWLSESLRALSSSVSYDDMASMLLSFPVDIDSSTQELISDLIYANSATLDGRRFAAEFATRRKADAAGRKAGKGNPSIADVVRSQPKPSPGNEWGAFKVVNKKKKGGRA